MKQSMGLRELFKGAEEPKYGIPLEIAQKVTAEALSSGEYNERTKTFVSKDGTFYVDFSDDARHGNELIVSAQIVSKPLEGAVNRLYFENDLIRKHGKDLGIRDLYETNHVTSERNYQPTIEISFKECNPEIATGQMIVDNITQLKNYLEGLKETSEEQNREQHQKFKVHMN